MGRQWYEGIRGKIFGRNRQTKWELFAVQYHIASFRKDLSHTEVTSVRVCTCPACRYCSG